jgi:MHS family proline/betaine transporter-like MFS transporter
MIPVLGYSGGLVALGVASFILYAEINWRGIFIFGALIALIGMTIRTRLRETKDFSDAHTRLKKQYNSPINKNHVLVNSSHKKTQIAMFCTQCVWPLCFFFVFIYCGQFLKNNFNYSALEVVQHNFIISIFPVMSCFIRAKLTLKFRPLILFKYSLIISFCLFIITGLYLENNPQSFGLGVMQALLLMFTANGYTESSVIFTHLPVLQRFKSACLSYAFSRAFMYIITSFGLIFIINLCGVFWGITFAISCVTFVGSYGLNHFLKLEQIHKIPATIAMK